MFAITTRNKLRGPRYAVNMIWAWRHVRRQLARTPGMLAYTTGIANPTEFYTLTLWQREIDMFLFMSSDAHRDLMWNFRDWTQSFWSMRWNAAHGEIGSWNGSMFGTLDDERPREPATHQWPGYLDHGQLPERLKPLLRSIARPTQPAPLDFDAVIGRIAVRSPAELFRVRRTLHPWARKPGLERFVLATGLGDCLVLAVWKGKAAAATTELMADIATHLPHSWAMRFAATDFEIGHWDRFRFRDSNEVDADPSPSIVPAR